MTASEEVPTREMSLSTIARSSCGMGWMGRRGWHWLLVSQCWVGFHRWHVPKPPAMGVVNRVDRPPCPPPCARGWRRGDEFDCSDATGLRSSNLRESAGETQSPGAGPFFARSAFPGQKAPIENRCHIPLSLAYFLQLPPRTNWPPGYTGTHWMFDGVVFKRTTEARET